MANNKTINEAATWLAANDRGRESFMECKEMFSLSMADMAIVCTKTQAIRQENFSKAG